MHAAPKVSEIVADIQSLMSPNSAPLRLIRPISSRFLQLLLVCNRVVVLLDALTVYYFAFLTEEEQTRHRHLLVTIFERLECPEDIFF